MSASKISKISTPAKEGANDTKRHSSNEVSEQKKKRSSNEVPNQDTERLTFNHDDEDEDDEKSLTSQEVQLNQIYLDDVQDRMQKYRGELLGKSDEIKQHQQSDEKFSKSYRALNKSWKALNMLVQDTDINKYMEMLRWRHSTNIWLSLKTTSRPVR